MKSKIPKRTSMVVLAAAVAVGGILASPIQAANPFPASETKDKVSSRVGAFRGGKFTPAGGGRSGAPTDLGADFGPAGGPIHVADATFFNTAAVNDEVSVAFWAKKYDAAPTANSAFWANSLSSNNGTRGYQAHLPWSDNVVYFDHGGCCNADQRLNAGIDTFANYSGDVTWWNDWHHFIFTKKGLTSKQVWIDGILFLDGAEAAALPSDFTDMVIGGQTPTGSLFRGVMDDFAVFSTQLTEADAIALAGTTLPSALPASKGLLAYWDFNDAPAGGQYISVSPAPDTTAAAPNLIQVVHIDGAIPWTQNNVSLTVDGVAAPVTVTKDGATATVRHVPATLFAIQSTHTAVLTTPEGSYEWQFSIAPYTKDTVASRIGGFTGGSGYSAAGGGRSGNATDYAADLSGSIRGPIQVSDGAFLNGPAAADEMSFAMWIKKVDIADSSTFWAVSPSSPSDQRGWSVHTPWSNNNVYFDTAGCCGGETRINAGIDSLATYSGDVAWWQDWHHFIFTKKADLKQIWIDGQLFLEGSGAIPLPTDFVRLVIGADVNGGGVYRGWLDDFSIFSTALSEAQALELFNGASPTAFPASAGLVAHWNFNDIPPDGIFLSFTSGPNYAQVVHLQGPNAWDLSKVSLSIDGVVVSATPVKTGSQVTIRAVPSPIFPPNTSHTAVLTYPTSGGGTATRSWNFTVGSYTRDTVGGIVGAMTGAAAFTANGGGKSGQPGDYAMDFGPTQNGQSVNITDLGWLNTATAADELAVAGWQKLHSVRDSAFVWGVSPSSNGGTRGWGTHTPWSNNVLYFDTAGCCDAATQRVNAGIDTFAGYTGDVAWWNDWHHFVFQKKGSLKEIWIDGQLFLQGDNTNPLPTDFSQLLIGFNPVDNGRLQGVLDDVAFFGTAFTDATIGALITGGPASLPASQKLLANWNFNDAPSTVVAPTLGLSRAANGTITLTFTGRLQTATALTGAGAWSDVQNATSGMTVQASDPARFYRAVAP